MKTLFAFILVSGIAYSYYYESKNPPCDYDTYIIDYPIGGRKIYGIRDCRTNKKIPMNGRNVRIIHPN